MFWGNMWSAISRRGKRRAEFRVVPLAGWRGIKQQIPHPPKYGGIRKDWSRCFVAARLDGYAVRDLSRTPRKYNTIPRTTAVTVPPISFNSKPNLSDESPGGIKESTMP